MLHRKVTLYVPGTKAGSLAPSLQARNTEIVLGQMARWFGGATQTQATGSWMGVKGDLIHEPINLVSANTDDEGIVRHWDNLLKLGAYIAQTQRQEAVSVEIDGQMEFIVVGKNPHFGHFKIAA